MMTAIPTKSSMFLLTLCTSLSLSAEPMTVPTSPPLGPMDIIFPFHDPDGKEFEKIAAELKLTQEQKEKARSLIEKREILFKEKSERMPILHEQLRTLLEAEKVDLNLVRAKLQEISNRQLDIRMIQIQGRLDFESHLTNDQREAFKNSQKRKLEAIRAKKVSNDKNGSGCVEPKK
jgi:Spy/CpxP family protein refolding chaperone